MEQESLELATDKIILTKYQVGAKVIAIEKVKN